MAIDPVHFLKVFWCLCLAHRQKRMPLRPDVGQPAAGRLPSRPDKYWDVDIKVSAHLKGTKVGRAKRSKYSMRRIGRAGAAWKRAI